MARVKKAIVTNLLSSPLMQLVLIMWILLTVTDPIGQSTSDSMEITIEEAPVEEEEDEDNTGSDDLIDVDHI
ncbi:MAG TPA: hypothetical protein VFZ67_04660 [Nitrososphaera sp.]